MEKDMKSMIFSAIERTSSFKIAARMFVTTIHSKGMPSFLLNNDTFISVFQMLDLHIKIGGPFFSTRFFAPGSRLKWRKFGCPNANVWEIKGRLRIQRSFSLLQFKWMAVSRHWKFNYFFISTFFSSAVSIHFNSNNLRSPQNMSLARD